MLEKVDSIKFVHFDYKILFVRINNFLGVRGSYGKRPVIFDYITIEKECDLENGYDILCYYIVGKLTQISGLTADQNELYSLIKNK